MRPNREYWGSIILAITITLLASHCAAPSAARSTSETLRDYIKTQYTKTEVRVPMRDGISLYAAVYQPVDDSRTYPLLIKRTPYSSRPYGPAYPSVLGPNHLFAEAGYIFISTDIRGRWMSEGVNIIQTPHNPDKRSDQDVDESSDAYDTIAWLLENIEGHNGKVGLWGISWPGFVAAASMIDAHPALAAVSPQSPMTDYYFDDGFHNGATMLSTQYAISQYFYHDHDEPHSEAISVNNVPPSYADEYSYFLNLGPASNILATLPKEGQPSWQEFIDHPAYDDHWKAKRILPHLQNVAPAVLTVGGWFDAEDLYGIFNMYQAVEAQNPGIDNMLAVGPWQHGGWARYSGDSHGQIRFGSETAHEYHRTIELPFFERYLKGAGEGALPEMSGYDTGSNQWKSFDHWPPATAVQRELYLQADGGLAFIAPPGEQGHDAFVSDPANPVPYTDEIGTRFSSVWHRYMSLDQRFAARRPDVLVYQTEPLEEDLTLAGPIQANLWVSTSAGDADWIVKLVDVYPDTADNPSGLPIGIHMGGYQMHVRSEVIRGRYRNSFEKPEPFEPGVPAAVNLTLQDLLHTFKAGHRIMVQIQSSWFPMVDRNPQKYVQNIFEAKAEDYIKATHTVYRSSNHPTHLTVLTVPAVE